MLCCFAFAALVAALRICTAAGSLLLFTSPGYSNTYKNTWPGWYHAGLFAMEGHSPMLAGYNGKRKAYDTAALAAVRFSDSSGAFAEYDLMAPYLNRSLLQIVQQCMGDDRSNTGSLAWSVGHCSSVGRLASAAGIPNVAPRLRIGVGDDPADRFSWALFALQWGTTDSSPVPGDAYAVGCAARTNPGYVGQVYIHGIQHAATPFGTGLWSTVTLPCGIDSEGCAHSPNFPQPYGDGQHCVLSPEPQQAGALRVPAFETEQRHDVLTVNGVVYSGHTGPASVVPAGPIAWSSDHSLAARGWRLCLTRAAAGAGLGAGTRPLPAEARLEQMAPPEVESLPGAVSASPAARAWPTTANTPRTQPPPARRRDAAELAARSSQALVSVMGTLLGFSCLGFGGILYFAKKRRARRCGAEEDASAVNPSDEDGLLG